MGPAVSQSPTPVEFEARVRQRLAAAGIDVAQEARWLVESATDSAGVDTEVLEDHVRRRLAGEPLQVIVGETAFRFVTVACRSGVFVPRPETEVVAGVAIEALSAWPSSRRLAVDLCTGTGAIALALASEVATATVLAVEVDGAAVALAQHNVSALSGRPRPDPWRPGDHLAPHASVEVRRGDLFGPLDGSWRGRVAVVVANPPYLPASDRGTWASEVAEHDPDRALVGGADGHEVVDTILADAGSWLAPGGTVVVELDERRADDAAAVAAASGLVDVRIVPDLAGRPRAVAAHTPRHPAPSSPPPPIPPPPIPPT